MIDSCLVKLMRDLLAVSINEVFLTTKGEKATSKQNKDKNYITREINYGVCERTIMLPDSADINKAKASFKKGMLWTSAKSNLIF